MKRVLALSLVLCTLLSCLAGCSSRKITVDNWIKEAWLYEEMKDSYEPGEQVVVKIQKKEDVGCWLILKGKDYEKVVHHNSSTDEYWQFEFTMPDVKIEMDMMVVPSAENNWDEGTAWAGYGGSDEFYFGALNRDKFSISSIKHLPIYKFDSLAELEQFKTSFANDFTFDQSYDEIQSFNDATQNFDDAFFSEYSLFLVYVSANSGSLRFGVNSVYNDGKDFCIYIEQLNDPENVTDDMAGWFILLPQLKSAVEGCSTFDARMGAPD